MYCTDDIESIIMPPEKIAQAVDALSQAITRDYHDKNPLIIGILRGAAIFMSDLVRKLDFPLELDFMAVSSYGASSVTSGSINIKKDTSESLEGRHVLIVEDIVDSGVTLDELMKLLKTRRPASIKLVSFINKTARRERDIEPDYCCITIPDGFVVGYGLDFANRYRHLPFVGILKPGVYQGGANTEK